MLLYHTEKLRRGGLRPCRSPRGPGVGAMGEKAVRQQSSAFGRYLRRLRERRRLTLADAESLSMGLPARVSSAYLSRLESGRAVPTLAKLATLGRIYDVAPASLVERFEIEQRLARVAADPARPAPDEAVARARDLKASGRYDEALAVLTAARESLATKLPPPAAVADDEAAALLRLRLGENECLIHLGYLETAKHDAERLLSERGLDPESRLIAWQHFVSCCFRLERHEVALAGLDQAERELDRAGVPDRMRHDLEVLRGNILVGLRRYGDAVEPYGAALRGYERLGVAFEACRARVHLGGALVYAGKPVNGREQLARALEDALAAGHEQLAALALAHLVVACYRLGDRERAASHAFRSNRIARERGYDAVYFRNTWYLLQIAREQIDAPAVRSHLRALRLYVGRVPASMAEAEEFRAELLHRSEGGEA